jgi:hypothetical protein
VGDSQPTIRSKNAPAGAKKKEGTMNYLAITAEAGELQQKLDSLEVEFKVRQIFPLVNDPRFLIFAERRIPKPVFRSDVIDAAVALFQQGLSHREVARQLRWTPAKTANVYRRAVELGLLMPAINTVIGGSK